MFDFLKNKKQSNTNSSKKIRRRLHKRKVIPLKMEIAKVMLLKIV